MTAMPPALSALADGFYRQQQAEARRLADAVQAAWMALPTEGLRAQFGAWDEAIPAVASRVTAAQYANAVHGAEYVDLAATLQGVDTPDDPDLAPTGFLSATEDVEDWLRAPMLHAASLALQGAPQTVAQRAGLSTLVRQTVTLAQDAGREATGVGITAYPGLKGYFRRLRTPSCSRCAVLAGRYYRDNEGFDRHPLCDCQHVPAAEPYDDAGFDAEDAIRQGQVTGLSKADREAILDHGADVSQVINAKRGVYTTRMYGDKVKATTEGTTARGLAGKSLGDLQKSGGRYRVAKRIRLTPSEILRQANGDSALARRLLERNGYLV